MNSVTYHNPISTYDTITDRFLNAQPRNTKCKLVGQVHCTHSGTRMPFPVTQSLCTQLQTKSTWDPHSEPSPLFMYTQTEITLCVARPTHGNQESIQNDLL